MLSCARMGMNVVEIDESVNTVNSLRKALTAGKLRTLVFCPEIEDISNNLKLLRKTIPEFYECNFVVLLPILYFDCLLQLMISMDKHSTLSIGLH